jgi:hypothetical protein
VLAWPQSVVDPADGRSAGLFGNLVESIQYRQDQSRSEQRLRLSALCPIGRRRARQGGIVSQQLRTQLANEQDPDARSMAWSLLTTNGPYLQPEHREQLFDLIERAPESPDTPDEGPTP